ncbi:uncharacterized protein [Amphiura filiformis]|uniref:uncharacterized protein n=1 Tax=Amphiura filiformis TaxID=82378 RepID=UPI003B2227DF
MGQGKYAKEDEGSSVFVLLCILVLIVGIVAAAGMVMAVLNYNRGGDAPININVDGSDSGGSRGGNADHSYGDSGGSVTPWRQGQSGDYLHYDETIWTFQNGDNDNRVIYIDRKTRQHRGHFIDVINEVCQIAGKNCEIVHSNWRDCWFDGFPQQALLGRWVDGCMGFSISADRVRSLKFSTSTVKATRPVLLTRRGNPSGVNADNLNGIKIGILAGWWADAYCIFRVTGYDIRDNQVFAYNQDDNLNTLVAGLDGGEVDAIFISGGLPRATDGSLELVREFEPCLLGGDSMMMRKDSLLKNWWDPAFNKLVNSRAYREICNDIDDPAAHGSKPGNSAADTCVNL